MDYELTGLGRSASLLAAAIRGWAEEHVDEIMVAREAYDERAGREPEPVRPAPVRTAR